MNRFERTAARQLDLLVGDDRPTADRSRPARRRPDLRLLRRDVYAELARRRRRAQINARHLSDER